MMRSSTQTRQHGRGRAGREDDEGGDGDQAATKPVRGELVPTVPKQTKGGLRAKRRGNRRRTKNRAQGRMSLTVGGGRRRRSCRLKLLLASLVLLLALNSPPTALTHSARDGEQGGEDKARQWRTLQHWRWKSWLAARVSRLLGGMAARRRRVDGCGGSWAS